MSHAESTRAALSALGDIPRDNDGPVFAAPWQAEVFAMTLTLYEQGVFAWSEWAACLGEQIRLARQAGDPDLGDTYYLHWLAALEAMVVKKNLGRAEQLRQLYQAWDAAAQATPHGQAIVLPGN